MKILVLTNLYPPHFVGGYELICQTAVKALQARGHVVEVLTSDHVVNGQKNSALETGVTRKLKIHGLLGHPWLPIAQLKFLEQHNNATLIQAIETLRPDLVYAWNCSGISKSMLFTLQRLGIPTVFAIYDHWVARSAAADVWLRWWNENCVSPMSKVIRTLWGITGYRRHCDSLAPTTRVSHLRFARIHFCSSALRELTANAGYNVRHGEIIYCPINVERFKSIPRPATAPMQRLLYVGRLHKDKGVMTTLRAMLLLRDKFAGSLHIYGRGEEDFETELRTFVQQNNLPVTFCPPIPPEQIQDVYAAYDALLFPSEWAEPFALTPLEAMASGLPVIGTMTGGSAELFRHGENALTYTAGNAEELAQRIVELESNGSLREQIATTGYHEVRLRFAEPVIMNQTERYLVDSIEAARREKSRRWDE